MTMNKQECGVSAQEHSDQLPSEAVDIITEQLGVRETDVMDIEVLKKGMTNRSFLFRC